MTVKAVPRGPPLQPLPQPRRPNDRVHIDLFGPVKSTDRSDRYIARDFAANYLNSCAKNAILFTNGDNDTFPLWYAQEVEGVRRDVLLANQSLMNTEWHLRQLKRQ